MSEISGSIEALNVIVLPAGASITVCRSEPAPLSALFVTTRFLLTSTLSSKTVKSPEPLVMKAISRLVALAVKGTDVFWR